VLLPLWTISQGNEHKGARPKLRSNFNKPSRTNEVENALRVEPVGEFELKGIERPLTAYTSSPSTLRIEMCDVAYWQIADVPCASSDVRYGGKTGLRLSD
jgi:hypothetical protein